jgi:hypothetical protein
MDIINHSVFIGLLVTEQLKINKYVNNTLKWGVVMKVIETGVMVTLVILIIINDLLIPKFFN